MNTQSKPKPEPNAGANSVSTGDILRLPVAQLLELLGTSQNGLSQEEAEKRREETGANAVSGAGRRPAVLQFFAHFKSPITIILLVAAVISGVLGDFTNLSIILLIVLVSVTLDFTQEYRAERAAAKLQQRVATTSTVIRDGRKQELPVPDLVPGDIVALSAGDVVPADARVLSARDFFVDQSALTGESFPAEKFSEASPGQTEGDTTSWSSYIFAGTSVTNGAATAVVVRTGSSTQYGEIVKRNIERKPETEFERGLRRFGYLILQVSFVLVVFVFLVNALYRHTVIEALLFSVALTVGLTPGLLPMILSINLSRGSSNMSRRGVIVKRLAAIQNFGSMDVLCADKTGTLTENRVTLVLHVDIAGNDSEQVLLYSYLNSYYQTGLRNPLDEAIMKHGELNAQAYRKLDEIPFDFVRKRLSVVVEIAGRPILITKGAPEEVLRVSGSYEEGGRVSQMTHDALERIEKEYHDLSAQGLRVLGVSYRYVKAGQDQYRVSEEDEMVFMGFIAFMDPLKPTAGESLELLRQAGVRMKVLTGDNDIVAANICRNLGFQVSQVRRGKTFDESLGRLVTTATVEPMNIVKGTEIEGIDDNALARVVERADIFTRVTPAQKSRIMNALKSNGHVVGFIGDGINDTPSMKVADVSISVENAVDIAKESAEIILLSNDLKLIRDGVIEGRKTFGNTMKYIQMAISSNFGNMFSAAAASLFLPFLPMLPIQILLNNLLYSFAQLSIPSDGVDQEYIARPQRLQIPFIRNFMLFFGPVSSIFDFLTFGVMLYLFHAGASLFQTAWFVESLFTQTLVIFAIRTRRIPFLRSRPSRALVLNIAIVLSVALALPYITLGRFFRFTPLPIDFLLILGLFIVAYLGLVEIQKAWFFGKHGPGRAEKS